MKEKKGKVTPISEGSGVSEEKQVNDDNKIETAVLVVMDDKGRIGISTQPGIPMKREMTASEVPGFLIEASMIANNIMQDGRIEQTVKRMFLQMAMPSQPVVATPAAAPVESTEEPAVEPAPEPPVEKEELDPEQTGE